MNDNLDYITDSFTKVGDNVNIEVNNAKIECLTSKNNKFSLDSDGNLNVKSVHANNLLILDNIYPVGSIYMNVNPTNPSTLFGGTWERISQGRCLMGEGVVQSNNDNWCGKINQGDWTAYAGNTGGEVYHLLTMKEMPTHSHGLGNGVGYMYVNGANSGVGTTGVSMDPGAWWHESYKGSLFFETQGGNLMHNNMPPYLVVYIWKRVS